MKSCEICVLRGTQSEESENETDPDFYAGQKIMKLDSKHIDLANRKIDLTCFTTKTLRTTPGSALSDNLAAILQLQAKSEWLLPARSVRDAR